MKAQTKTIEYNFEASEFNWEIAPGKTVQAWGFNQQLPGPTLRATAGDTLVVRVSNKLNEPTMIHWHGIKLPATMDGTDVAQKPIQPGETFEYRFVVPDAGSFWYHAHMNETVQMERGMYGALIVEDESDLKVDNERIFMIDDMKLNKKNEFTKPSWYIPRAIERHDGRQGDTLLLNGKEQLPVYVNGGQTERWRFINSSSARYFQLYMGGKEFKIIATDGGLIEHPVTVTQVLITPGERLDILIDFKEGETFALESLAYNRTTMFKAKRETFTTVYAGENKPTKAFIPEHLTTIKQLATQHAAANRTVTLSVDPRIRDQKDFRINNGTHTTDAPVRVGELQIWEIKNTSRMDHPFHLHGFFFQVLEENGKAPSYKAWKDTVNLLPTSTIKIAWMPDNRPGTWMYHCHIVEHHAAGMMAHFNVINDDEPVVTNQHSSHHHPMTIN